LGSILAQLVVASGSADLDWFGKAILMYVERPGDVQELTRLMNGFSLTICNISGAALTKLWVPNPCDANGESRKLEDFPDGNPQREGPATGEEATDG
jgi:hypothetical protein